VREKMESLLQAGTRRLTTRQGAPARWVALLLGCCLLLAPALAYGSSGKIYDRLDKLIKETPPEQMTVEWLVKEVYQKYPEPQKMLKKILGQTGMEAKNERMGCVRQAMDLEFWFHIAKIKGRRTSIVAL
jgi:hypothetical protein